MKGSERWDGSPGGAHVSTDTLTGWEQLMHRRRFPREGRDAVGRRRNRRGRRDLAITARVVVGTLGHSGESESESESESSAPPSASPSPPCATVRALNE